jgi:hypothetical protein
MKASELRIGNLVNDYQFKKPLKVTIGVLEEIENGMDFYEPIPLTEEWLVKFGFEEYDRMGDNIFFAFKKEDNFKFNLHLFFLELSVSFYGLNWERAIKLKYVHQLQNLYFAITGEELSIE